MMQHCVMTVLHRVSSVAVCSDACAELHQPASTYEASTQQHSHLHVSLLLGTMPCRVQMP